MNMLRYVLVGMIGGGAMAFARDASANNLDIDSGDSYPSEVAITSPSGYDSLFTFNNSYAMGLSDANFDIDAYFNSDGTLNSYSSVTITTAINTGACMSGPCNNDPIFATLEWQATAGANNAHLNAFTGDVEITLVFKINFTGSGWKGATETCRTQAFTVDMGTSAAYTYPYTGGTLHGSPYSFTSGSFRGVSNGFNIADFPGTSNCTATHKSTIQSRLSVGGGGSASAMKVDVGFPTYDFDGLKVHGS